MHRKNFPARKDQRRREAVTRFLATESVYSMNLSSCTDPIEKKTIEGKLGRIGKHIQDTNNRLGV